MDPSAALSGDLAFIGLGELLQLIGANCGTGVLTLSSPHVSHTGTVFIQSGDPVDALCAAKSGQEALMTLFGWIEGAFEFHQSEIYRPRVIRQGRMSLILDGMRLLDEGAIPKLTSARPFEVVSRQTGDAGTWIPMLRGPLMPYGDVVDEETFTPGTMLVEEGKHGQWVYAILDGEAEVMKTSPMGPIPIMRLGPGTFAGYLGFFTNEKERNVTVVARKTVTAGVLNSERLLMELYERSLLFTDMLRSLSFRLRRLLDSYHSPVDDERTQTILKSVTPVADAPRLIESGLFRLDRGVGALVAHINGNRFLIEELAKGDFIGKFPFGGGLESGIGHELNGTPQFSVSPVDSRHLLGEFRASSATMRQLISHLIGAVAATALSLNRHLQTISKESTASPEA